MSCLDSATLWALEAGELEGDDLTAARAHARCCLVCETGRRELQQTRRLLELAGGAAPTLSSKSWRSVDAAVDEAVTAAAARSFRGFSWRTLFVPALALSVMALFVVSQRMKPTEALPAVSTGALSTEAAASTKLESIAKTAKSAAKSPSSNDSAKIAAASDVRGAAQAQAQKSAVLINGPRTLTLPHGATMQLGANAVAERGSVIALKSGDALVRARKGSAIRTGTATLRPQSDVVLLASAVDVAVMEGSVLVERDDGSSLLLHAGEGVRYERGASVHRGLDAKRFAAFNVTLQSGESPASADLLFIERARASLKQGRCGDFLLGLETLAFDAEAAVVKAKARITKARCHDERLEPGKAAADYSRYLRDFPDGEAASEARSILRAQ